MSTLNPEQTAALLSYEHFLVMDADQFFVLEGFSGSGKTYLTEQMLTSTQKAIQTYQLLNAQRDITYEICATTNKAAEVLSRRIQKPVDTIYSSLKISLSECYKTGKEMLNFKHCRVDKRETIYFIDEASYLSDEMLSALMEYRPNSKFVLIGDRYQLPPIGILEAPAFDLNVPSAMLTQFMRNKGALAQLTFDLKEGVRKSKAVPIYDNGQDIIVVDGAGFQREIDAHFSDPNVSLDSGRVLGYYNETTREYGQYIRGLQGKPEDMFVVGDKAICNTTFLDIKTDELVTIEGLSRATKDEYDLETWHVHLAGGRSAHWTPQYELYDQKKKALSRLCSLGELHWKEYFEFKNTFIDLRDPHALTTHKSQGSTYHTAFLDLHDLCRCPSPGLLRRLKYVAASRAAERLVVYGH